MAEACDSTAPGGAETQRGLFEEGLVVLIPQLGAEHLEVARARIGLAAALFRLDRAEDSQRLCNEVLTVLRCGAREEDIEVAWAKFHLAIATLRIGGSDAEKVQAERWLEEARLVLEPSVGALALQAIATPGHRGGT